MDQKPPTAVIDSAHREHLGNLPFDDTADFEDTDRGFIAALNRASSRPPTDESCGTTTSTHS